MMQLWFRALARKSLSGQKSPAVRRCARPRAVSLRLEAVEDRTLAQASPLELPTPTLPAPETVGPTHSGKIVKIPAGEQATNDDSAANLPPGLVVEANPWGLADFESPTRGFEGPPVTFAGDGKISPVPAVELDSAPPPVTLSGGIGPVAIERVESPTAEVARPEKLPASPATESAQVSPTAGDAGRVSSDHPAAPTAQPAGAATATSSEQSRPASAGDRVADNPNPRLRRAEAQIAQPAQDNSHRPAAKSDSAAGPRRASRSAAPTLPRADINRLTAEVPDGSLLHRYVANREEAAFTALVRRHERLVLSVCQRVLGDWHAAQDALQTTFLVLARKAGMLDRQIPLTNWLYTVAYHAALRLRAVTARHRVTEAAAAEEWPTRSDGEVGTEVERLEIQQAIREELQSLPAEYREPLALCYVDGRTHSDAAREIGLPRGSMAKRIGEGLDRLRERLVDRGVSS
jgi:RNA polymerase sigma factor (sigma-70 family)